MATYKIKGARFLRKYTARSNTPTYAAAADAQLIVDSLCDVPWQGVGVDEATMTSHSDTTTKDQPVSGLDRNVLARDNFDAALFCAGHSGGNHRAYANAACYRYTLPDGAVGLSLSSIKVRVTSDPYNAAGARLHVFTNSTGEIPLNCRTLRGEDSSGAVIEDGSTVAGVAPRTSQGSGSNTTWYSATELVTLSPSGGLTLQKYLFLVVALESYSTVRGNWLEGCSYIQNSAEITLTSAVESWTDGEKYDCSGSQGSVAFNVVKNGALPMLSGDSPAAFTIELQRTGDLLPDSSESTEQPIDASTLKTSATVEQSAIGLRLLYAELFEGNIRPAQNAATAPRPGATFAIESTTVARKVQPLGSRVDVPVWRLSASALVVPFAAPTSFVARRLRLDWSGFAGEPTAGTVWRVWLKRGSADRSAPSLAARELYLPTGADVDGFSLLGEIAADGEATEAEFEIDSLADVLATVMITGYCSMDSINPASGMASVYGCAIPFVPDITLIG